MSQPTFTPIPAVAIRNTDGMDREYESNPRFLAVPNFGLDYGPQELALAFAISDTGAGGGGTPAGTIATGIDISVSVPAILADTTAILTSIGNASSLSGDDDVIGQLKLVNDKLEGDDANSFVEFTGSAGTISSIASAADTNTLEVTIQNKSNSESMFLRLGATADPTNSYIIPPLNALSFNGLLAEQSLNVIREGSEDVNFYGIRTLK